ncbi:phosphotransferase [Variovorax saccharolyticus]|uniref:phosphotransferase n=1 Tax=Variovorax saccharolyticus TaxID=3053516 RepID=UPI0025768F86|nr:phosphotransferase [Variovorax sp. J31P216]MDM0024588.1 phosphotransferase [Variovorax sp. J31P216]
MSANSPETAPRPLDTVRLAAWLEGRLPGLRGPLSATRFKGGQSNPTYLLSDAAGARYVLRKQPDGVLLPSAHAVDREYRVLHALGGTDVPVARVHCFCDDPQVVGTPFYVMAFVDGRVLWDPALPGMPVAGRSAIYDEMNRVVAALHRVDVGAAGLADYGRPGAFFERQIARWTRQYQATVEGPGGVDAIPAMERLIEWLPANVPVTPAGRDESCIFHGDLRIDNMIFHPSEPRVLALLDWELSTLGHPLADFAYHALPWRLGAQQFRGMAGADFAALGIPGERAYLDAYCRRVGREPVDPSHWEFYLAYAMFRLAAILQGILKRSHDGTASSAEARETGARARPIAEAAWRQVEAHFPRTAR